MKSEDFKNFEKKIELIIFTGGRLIFITHLQQIAKSKSNLYTYSLKKFVS